MDMNFRRGEDGLIQIESVGTVNQIQADEIRDNLGPDGQFYQGNSLKLGEYIVITDSLGEGRKWLYLVR